MNKGLKTQHQITSDGQINAQVEIEWESREEKGWTYRRLKNKNRNLKAIKKRVVAYAQASKNPLYMLGDWLDSFIALHHPGRGINFSAIA